MPHPHPEEPNTGYASTSERRLLAWSATEAPMANPSDEIRQSLDNLRKAADAVADKILGTDVTGHLREAARHGLRAAKAALDKAEHELDRRKGDHVQPAEPTRPVDAPAPFTTPAP